MKWFSRALFLLFFFVVVRPVAALNDPRSVPNNQFGIHVVDPNDIDGVQKLLNSNGGEWGYVKFVIPETDRDTDKWNHLFRELRRRKLIPIVRVATQVKDESWVRPSDDSLKIWPTFLNSLSWPTENRYIILFNEPNHAKEWGGTIDPEDYAKQALSLAQQLKQASEDYFILPAGLDDSAPSYGESLSADEFLRIIHDKVPEFFSILDGWTSHSYPNPAFSAPPTKEGRGSLKSYEWELDLLKKLGITKNYPILIGETGWTHQNGITFNQSLLSTQTVANYITAAGQTVWRDGKIFAVTPFLYNYQEYPFDIFSWKEPHGTEFLPHYLAYQLLPKTRGEPKQRESYKAKSNPLPRQLVGGSFYEFPITLQNRGEAIISRDMGYSVVFDDASHQFTFSVNPIPKQFEPDDEAIINMTIKTPEKSGDFHVFLKLQHGSDIFTLSEGTITVIPPPALKVQVQLGWQKTSEASSASVLVYDGNKVLDEFKDLPVNHGEINTPGLLGVIPGEYYRIVTIVPYYLPRQSIQVIDSSITTVTNRRFFPFDTDNDQQLSIKDFFVLIQKQPSEILPRFFGT